MKEVPNPNGAIGESGSIFRRHYENLFTATLNPISKKIDYHGVDI